MPQPLLKVFQHPVPLLAGCLRVSDGTRDGEDVPQFALEFILSAPDLTGLGVNGFADELLPLDPRSLVVHRRVVCHPRTSRVNDSDLRASFAN